MIAAISLSADAFAAALGRRRRAAEISRQDIKIVLPFRRAAASFQPPRRLMMLSATMPPQPMVRREPLPHFHRHIVFAAIRRSAMICRHVFAMIAAVTFAAIATMPLYSLPLSLRAS